MNAQEDGLVGAKETMLYTLYFRALDHRSEEPLLGDAWADEVLRKLDFTPDTRAKVFGGLLRYLPLLRAKRFDSWAREFLARHPDATVLHLGCGLDSRAFRLEVPETVRWFDLDYPEVVAVRQRVYPERAGYRLLSTSVADLGWMDQVPQGGPVLFIAEGLLPYVPEEDVRRLFDLVVTRFAHGELLFDTTSKAVTKLSSMFHWYLEDPRDIEQWHSRLRMLDDIPVTAESDLISSRGYQTVYRLANRTSLGRGSHRNLRYRLLESTPA